MGLIQSSVPSLIPRVLAADRKGLYGDRKDVILIPVDNSTHAEAAFECKSCYISVFQN